MRRSPLALLIATLCTIASGALATAFAPPWTALTAAGHWYATPLVFVAACVCAAPPYMSAYMALKRNENPFTWAIAGFFVWYIAVAVLWFSEVAEDDHPARPAKVERLNALARATGRPMSLAAANAFSLHRWNKLAMKEPVLQTTQADLRTRYGEYAAELFAADYLAFHQRLTLHAIVQGVEREMGLIATRAAERAKLEAEETRHGTPAPSTSPAEIARLFASTNGIAAELSDKTFVAEVNGKFTRYLSAPTYRDTHNDWASWQMINEQRDAAFAVMKLAASGALAQRPRNRLAQSA